MISRRLQIETREFGKFAIVRCSGRVLSPHETEFLFDAVTDPMRRSRCILLNLAAVRDIDAGGLGMLMLLSRFAEAALAELKICRASTEITELFRLMKLGSCLDLHNSEGEAIQSFFSKLGIGDTVRRRRRRSAKYAPANFSIKLECPIDPITP